MSVTDECTAYADAGTRIIFHHVEAAASEMS
jgi:hypothetical protein